MDKKETSEGQVAEKVERRDKILASSVTASLTLEAIKAVELHLNNLWQELGSMRGIIISSGKPRETITSMSTLFSEDMAEEVEAIRTRLHVAVDELFDNPQRPVSNEKISRAFDIWREIEPLDDLLDHLEHRRLDLVEELANLKPRTISMVHNVTLAFALPEGVGAKAMAEKAKHSLRKATGKKAVKMRKTKGNETRDRILAALKTFGIGAYASQIAERAVLSTSTVRQQLKVLEEQGLVKKYLIDSHGATRWKHVANLPPKKR